MRADKRTDRQGYVYYSFIYTDPETKKRVRLKKEDHPNFTTKEAAEAWAKTHEAYQHSQIALVRLKMAWLERYTNFADLLPEFETWHQKRAPNSYTDAVRYLKYFIFSFFLTDKHENNVNNWHLYYTDFKTFLETAQTLKSDGVLSYSSKNNCIASLNSFVKFLQAKNLIHPSNAVVCPSFESHLVTTRDIESVIPDDESEKIHKKLIEIDQDAADFWKLLEDDGMRFNEQFGLDITTLFAGHTTGPLHEEMMQHKLEYHGIIVLQDQPANPSRTRDDKGHIARKPLKGRKKISPRNNRTIPIRTKEGWNILARRHKIQTENFRRGIYGPDPKDYVYFDSSTKTRLNAALMQACEELGLILKRDWHDKRHTFTTFLVGKTRSFFLTKTILGHRSDAFETYNHIFELISIRAKQSTQVIEEI